ncbi:hypothetical protein QTG54_007176 [Skeletonema marinoi]|uniref:Uncharacterized protein n=1 Tax=Skeletonema marinoi TaxID=267567 RepID=A0AAD8YA24_9STRA|nr:hypothetical protein QTG54_007176 [Skeletonema marinoi]
MGVFKVINAVVGGGAEVAEPEEPGLTLIDMIVSQMTDVPLDGTSLLFCMAMSLSLCFVVVLAIAPRSGLQHVCEKEESGEQTESEQKDTHEVGELMGKIINTEAEAEQDDTEDETVSKDDSKPYDEPPTPTMSPPPTETIDMKGVDKNSSENIAPSIPDMSMTRMSSRRKGGLTAKAKSIGGSIRRLGLNEYTSKLQ